VLDQDLGRADDRAHQQGLHEIVGQHRGGEKLPDSNSMCL
jgi:hypothetical protein